MSQSSQSTPSSSASTPSTSTLGPSATSTPHAMDSTTSCTPVVPTAIVKPFSQTPSQTPPGRQSTAISGIGGPTQTSVSAAHQGHTSATSGLQASTLRPAHLGGSRPRTMSASRGEMPAALDLSAIKRQQPSSMALDLSSTGRQTSTVSGSRVLDLTSPGRRAPPSGGVGGGAGFRPEVIDLTSPARSGAPPGSWQVASLGSLQQRTNPAVDLQSPLRNQNPAAPGGPPSQGPSSPRAFPRSSAVDLLASPSGAHRPVQGFSSPGSLRSPSGGARAGFPNPRLQALGQTPPPQSRNPASPFSSPLNPSSSSAASSPATLRPTTSTADEASDLDLTSDQGDDLALTSPDRLTSDVRHHFHGDLL